MNKWLKLMLGAAAAGALNAAAQSMAGEKVTAKSIATAAASGAALGGLAYALQSPVTGPKVAVGVQIAGGMLAPEPPK